MNVELLRLPGCAGADRLAAALAEILDPRVPSTAQLHAVLGAADR